MSCTIVSNNSNNNILIKGTQYAILYNLYRKIAIMKFVAKLNEKYTSIHISCDDLFDENGNMRSYYDAKATKIFNEMMKIDDYHYSNAQDGQNFKTDLYNHYNAFQHTFVPALFAATIGKQGTIDLGDYKEIFTYPYERFKVNFGNQENYKRDTYKDLNNNAIGADYGEKYANGEITYDELVDILFQSVMKKNRDDDSTGIIATNEQVTQDEYNSFSMLGLLMSRSTIIKKIQNVIAKNRLQNSINIPQMYNIDNTGIQSTSGNEKSVSYEASYNGYRCKFFGGGGAEASPHDPIIFDLDGDGIIETTNIYYGVYFDHDNNGFAENSAWIGEYEGILIIYMNNNDEADNGSELITMDNISQFDINEDGIIDCNDSSYNELKILKGDGTIVSLAEAGILSINLNTTETNSIDENNNTCFAEGSFTRTNGETGKYGAYYLDRELSESIAVNWLEETDEISALPDINGRGTVYSLHQAMLRDESGELKNLVQQFTIENNDNVRQQLVEQILAKWTDTQNIVSGSRGKYIDAQHLAILEKFMGQSFWSTYDEENGGENVNPANPNLNAGQILETSYQMLKTNIYANLIQQTHMFNYLLEIEPHFDSETNQFMFNLDTVTTKLEHAIAQNSEVGKALAIQFVTTLKGLGLANFSNYFDPFDDNCLYTKLTHNDRDLKWAFDSIGKVSYVDPDGEGEGTGADDAFMAEDDDYYSNFHGLTGDDVMYGCDGSDYFYACSGDDILDGGNGDDVLASHSGNDTIFGGEGNDIIQAADGDDIILGGDGDDLIYPDHSDDFNYANSGNDIIRGDKGNDTIYSMTGDDTFIFNLGDGQDIVYEKQGVDTFYFGNGITWDDLIFEQVGNDMIIKINNTSDQITVKDWFLTTGENYKYDNNKIEIFEFADGSKHYKDEITVGNNSESIVYNMSEIGDYVEIASGYKTKVYLKSGSNKILEGKNSNDTFVFSQQGTYAQIENFSNNNTIVFGEGISLENIRFEINEEGLQISFDNFDGHITIIGDLDCSTTFKFADNTEITNYKDYLKKDIASSDYTMWQTLEEIKLIGSNDISVIGNNLNNTISGNSGNNTFEGKGGDDYIESKLGGNDTYIFNLGDGNDTISDIGGLDTLEFGAGITLENISFTRNYATNSLEITFNIEGYYDNKITIENYFTSDDNKIEKIVFADGTEITDVTQYLYANTYDTDFTLPENIHNGSMWGWDHISATGNNLDNWIGANSGDNTFNGGLGNDSYWDGIGGNERYIYNLGDGNDFIDDNDGLDAIIFGNGITKDNIIFTQDNNDLVITFNGSENNSIRIGNYFASDDNKIELFKFSDGTVIDNISSYLDSQVENIQNGSIVMDSNQTNATLTGNGDASVLGNLEDNVIVGNSGNNVYAASGGDDTITDIQGGNDTYLYNLKSGNDVIIDLGGIDTIKFGTDITADMLKFERFNNNLLISFRDDWQEGSLTINNYFLNDDYKIERFVFKDGTVLTDLSDRITCCSPSENYTMEENSIIDTVRMAGNDNISVVGNSADNKIYGNSGNNTFEGKGGNDTFIDHQGGNDTYIYNLGDGNDIIDDIGGVDKIVFGEGITLENLAFMQTSDNLNIWFHNLDGGITILNYFTNPDKKIERFELADGTVITDISNYITAIGSEESIVLPDGVSQAHLWGTGDISATGNNLNNWLGGNSGNNTFEGKGGNDYIWDDQGGDDTYIYNLGDGHDTINDFGGVDTIKFGEGITKDNLLLIRHTNGNLYINFVNVQEEYMNGSISIEGYFNDSNKRIEKFEFANGSVLSDIDSLISKLAGEEYADNFMYLPEVELWGNEDATVNGSYGNEKIYGNSGNNTYNPQGGVDEIYDTQGGNDTYIYNRDSNTKYVLDIGGNDTIKFGTGIEVSKTLFIKSNDDLRIYFPNENNVFIQIEGYFADDNKKIERFEFADGTVITDLANSLNGILSDSNITISSNQNAAYLDGNTNASVIGSANNDMIFGNSGNNTYNAGLGDDSIEDRQGGDDTYIYNLGDGYDNISDVGGNDTLRFGAGISLDSVDFEDRNKDLYINIYNNGQKVGSICISKYFKNDARKIENIEFADGTIITDVTPYLSSIYVKEDYTLDENSSIKSVNIIGKKDVEVVGNSADNHFAGNSGNNTIEGKGGNDSFWDEQGGNDTYIFNYGDGWNWLHDKYGEDTIVFKEGITASDTKFYINGKSLEIRISNENGWGGTVFIDNYFDESNDYKIEKIKYADGTEITDVSNILYGIVSETENIILDDKYIGADVQGNLNLNITGNAHDNFIVGNAGNNTMTGGLGNDNLFDNQGGDDTYVYNLGDGYDFITDIGGNDTIRFGEGITASNIRMNRQDNGNLEIHFDGYEGNIVVSDYFNNDENKIERIVLSDNTVITDFSQFFSSVETSESYTITEGSAVQDIYATGSADITLTGDSKNNTISGNSGNNTFEGKGGNDRLIDSEGGNDTYIYNLGDGDDTINDVGGIDTLKFGAGISIEDLEFMQAGNNLNMWFKERDGGIIIENYFSNPENKIERFEFADGTVITDITNHITAIGSNESIVLPDGVLQAHLWGDGNTSATGNSLDNWLGGNSGNNTFEGKGGNDYFHETAGGNDTYIYNLGDGSDVICDVGGYDTIRFGAGITTSNLRMSKIDNGNLNIYFDGYEGNIVVSDYFNNDENKIEKIILSDNTIITDFSQYMAFIETSENYSIADGSIVQDIQATGTADITLIGDSKNNTISGNSGNNTFEGKAGNDRLIDSEGGNDTYIYNVGDGTDYITDIGGVDTIKFGAGITLDNLAFMQTSDNLSIWFHNLEGGITIENYYTNPNKRIERFELADGTVITDISNYITAIGSVESIVLPDGVSQAHLWGTDDISATGNNLDNWFGGNSGNNTFEGKGGNDYFWDDQGGDDTYIYNLGDGYDFIHDENGSDTIHFGQGISAADLSFVHPTDSNNLEVLIGDSGKITIENYFSSDVYKIETFKFADNSILTNISSLITEINYSQTQSIVDETEALGEFDVNQLIQEINSYGVDNDVVMTNSQNQNEDLLLVMGN